MTMYSALDPFLASGTWHAGHKLDEDRFYQSIAPIVRDPDFHPDAMGEYIQSNVGTGFEPIVDDLVAKAWAVRDYLSATGE